MKQENNETRQETLGETYQFLAGYVDENEVVHKDFTIKEITGEEEEAIAKSGIKENGGKVVRTILERCITSIGELTPKIGSTKWREVIQKLSVPDQDFALMKIRVETLGAEIEMTHKCPNPECKADLNSVIDMSELEVAPFNGNFEMDFELPRGYVDKDGKVHKVGKLRYPNGFDREILDTVAKTNLGTANTMLITRCMMSLEDVKIHDGIIRSMGLKDREYLLGLLQANSYGVKLETELTCSSCGQSFKTSLNLVNFL